MPLPGQNKYQQINRTAALYNLVPSLLWSGLFMTPAAFYCYYHVPAKTCYIALGVSLAATLLPHSFFDRIQLSKNPQAYKRMGVKYVNALTQNGKLLVDTLKKKYPDYKVVSNKRSSIKKQYNQTYFFERFHFSVFLFFCFLAVHAGIKGYFYWMLFFVLSNLLYNVYPNLLQQYMRLKLRSALREGKIS